MDTQEEKKVKLLDFLDYTDPVNHDYIINKRHVTIGPESGATYDPTSGSRLMRFKLASSDWLEPNSVALNFTLNAAANNVPFFKEPHAFFKRCRLLSKGVLIEDITEFNRVMQAGDLQRSANERESNNIGGVPVPFEYGTTLGDNAYIGVRTDTPITVNLKLKLGLFVQSLLLPLRYLDLSIELELSDALDPVFSLTGAAASFNDVPVHTTGFNITNPTIKMNVITLDTAAANKFTGHLLSGGFLSVPFVSTYSSLQTVTQPDVQVNVSRALSHLQKMIVSYDVDIPAAGASTRGKYYNKPWTSFWAPRGPKGLSISGSSSANELVPEPTVVKNGLTKLQAMIGSKSYPEYPVESVGEAYKYFSECCDGECAINQIDYYNDQFLFGMNFQNNKETKITGMNIKNQPIIIHSKTHYAANRIHVILYNESILEISDTNVSVYD